MLILLSSAAPAQVALGLPLRAASRPPGCTPRWPARRQGGRSAAGLWTGAGQAPRLWTIARDCPHGVGTSAAPGGSGGSADRDCPGMAV